MFPPSLHTDMETKRVSEHFLGGIIQLYHYFVKTWKQTEYFQLTESRVYQSENVLPFPKAAL